MDPKTYRYTDMRFLHPYCRGRFVRLEEALKAAYSTGQTRSLFLPFETYRHPARQQWLLEANKGATKAGMFESAHQFGMAVDFVAWDYTGSKNGTWSWADDEDWEFLKGKAQEVGLLVPITWDKAHVESPLFHVLKTELRMASSSRQASKATKRAIDELTHQHLTEQGSK